MLYPDAPLGPASCYLMGVAVDAERRREIRAELREEHGVMTTVFPAVHQLSAYSGTGASLPRTEEAAASHIVIPLYPLMDEADIRRVVDAISSTTAA